MKMFDDLFDKFFGRNRKPKEEPRDEKAELIVNRDFVNKLMDSIKNMENFNKNFGPPTKVEYAEIDGVYYKRETWNTHGGEMVHVMSSNEPFKREPIQLSDEEMLKLAVENENYEEAVRLRDKINLNK